MEHWEQLGKTIALISLALYTFGMNKNFAGD